MTFKKMEIITDTSAPQGLYLCHIRHQSHRIGIETSMGYEAVTYSQIWWTDNDGYIADCPSENHGGLKRIG